MKSGRSGPSPSGLSRTPIVLASASARRLELLRQIGIEPIVRPSDIPEVTDPKLSPSANTEVLARAKARAVAFSLPEGSLVIGADTLVVLDGRLLGKPADEREAIEMLLQLSGREHVVCTGVCVARTGRANPAEFTAHAQTRVRMRAFGRPEAVAYARSGEPQGKAGAYAIQGRGALLVDEIIGDYSNVVGLPLALTVDLVGRLLEIQPSEILLDGSIW